MQVDYQHNKTEIKAFNLEDGSLLWETDQLDLNGKNGLQMVSVLNGETLWTQKEFKGGIGELLYEDKTDRLLAITVPATDGALDLLTTTPEVIALEANSGELLWKADYIGDLMPNYATIVNNTLVLPYFKLAFIDLQPGTEHPGDVHSRVTAARNVTEGLGGLIALDKAMGGSFGTNKDTPSKYNRLIPRLLHFNSDEKLCYFTMFDKNGKWGTGGKKEQPDLLGQQWTVVQDDMVDGIFYVKASGNMNRTIIKAIDAQTGEEIGQQTRPGKGSFQLNECCNHWPIY